MNDKNEMKGLKDLCDISAPYSIAKDAEYVKDMVEKLKALNLPKRPVSTVQCASTQAILDRPKDQDAARQAELFSPTFWLDLKEKSKAEHPEETNRPWDLDQIRHVEAIRHRPKNSIGQSEKSAITNEKRQHAEDAFLYTPPAEIIELTTEQKERLMEPIPELTPIEVQEKPGWWRRLTMSFTQPLPENNRMIDKMSPEDRAMWQKSLGEKKNED